MGNEIINLLRDRRLWAGSAIPFLVCFGIANWGVRHWQAQLTEERQKNLLLVPGRPADLGQEAAAARPVRYDHSCSDNTSDYWKYIPDATKSSLAILCGMSQLYAINDMQPGDQTISEWMDDRLAPQGVRVFGLAAPNLCNEEALLLLLACLHEPRTKPAAFIYAVCFDKFRNVDLRPRYQAFLQERPGLVERLQDLATANAAAHPRAAAKIQGTLDMLQRSTAKEDTFESRLRQCVAGGLPLVAARRDLNHAIQMQFFFLRNLLLGIKPTSKRPVIQERFALNQDFLGLLADVARTNGVELILYVIPLNPVAENPYIPQEYEDFKVGLEAFARERGLPFANLEQQVPTEDWGDFLGGPDFKHFRGGGHRLTAQRLVERFGPVLTAP